jgi:hypothetical protein
VTNQPGRDNEASNSTVPPTNSEVVTDVPPPTYQEVVKEKNSQDSIKPNETTALNAGEKVGYTPGTNMV